MTQPASGQWSAPIPQQPSGRTSRRPYLIVVAAALVLGGIVAVALIATRGGSHSSPYGKDPVAVARQLKVCPDPQRSRSVAVCHPAAGGSVAVSTTDSRDEQALLIATIKDQQPGECVVVLPGVVIGAADEPTLTGAIGIPEQFAHDHGGYLLCPA